MPTLAFATHHWLHGDPWVGPNDGGANLADSQMAGGAEFRVVPAAADQWQHVVLTTSAFTRSRANFYFYPARAVTLDQTFFGSLRQFDLAQAYADTPTVPTTVDLDELRLVTLPPTANLCPPYVAKTVSATGGDVTVPITLVNPTAKARSYRVFVSSELGLDRQTIEMVAHDINEGSAEAFEASQGTGGLGAAELFASDANGQPTGPSLVASGQPIAV
jgi:hypothetical protein